MTFECVRGVDADSESRCVHYGSERDVVALKFSCCEPYFACYKCHVELTNHDAEPWPKNRRAEPAVRCGVCKTAFSADEYVLTDACPKCEAAFNPGCINHYHRYFEWIDEFDEP